VNISAKEFLSQAYRIDQRINSKIEQVQSLRNLAAKATATLSDIPPVSGERNVHRMEDVIIKMVDVENEIHNDINLLLDIKKDVGAVIKRVKDPEQQVVLELRYLCFKTWEQIAVDMNYGIDNIFRIHRRALNAVEIVQ
jgi:hypothetical protein